MRLATFVATVGAVFVGACGARSGLEVELDSRFDGGVRVRSDCPAAVDLAAPAPVPGYCPTHANRSAFEAPHVAPETRWTLDLPGHPDFSSQLIVGRGARLYTVIDLSPDDGVFVPTLLVAIDDRAAEGVIAWTVEFDGSVSAPLLLADATLLVSARTADGSPEAVWLDTTGRILRRAALPRDAAGPPLLGADGSLYFVAVDLRGDRTDTVVAVDSAGRLRWRSAPFTRGSYPAPVLGVDDRVITRENRDGEAWIVSLDAATGARAWETRIEDDAPIIDGPAIGRDGAVYTVVWTDDSTTTTLVVLEPDGTMRLRVRLPDPPWGGAVTSLSVAADGAAYVKAGEGFTAISAAGDLLFHRAVHPNVGLGGVIDSEGTLLLGGGGVDAVRGTDGTLLWHYEVPPHSDTPPEGGARFYFAGPATLGDGALYFADAGGRLTAASP